MNNQCLVDCPADVSIKFDTGSQKACTACEAPCYTCAGTPQKCTTCIPGFYFLDGECISECPKGYVVNDDQQCYRASENTLPFITMVGPVAFLLTVAISNIVDKRTKPITGFLALNSSYMTFFWVYQIVFLLRDGHNSAPILIAVGLGANYVINCIFYEFLKSRLLNGKDKLFNAYQA